jgi:DNA-binding LacI/PurR family transcriptional regulator
LVCAHDRVAFGVIAAISETGASIGIGRDYRVAGHDNQRFSAYTSPPLTTVAQDVERMSRVAFELLIEKMDQADGVTGSSRKRAPRALLNGELVLRQSA